jgi:uncharacterized protein YjiS (DUF1127 family)
MATTIITCRLGLIGHGGGLSSRQLWTAISAAAERLSTALIVWHERACQRRQLLALSDAALKDFGASRADAVCEAEKPVWRC